MTDKKTEALKLALEALENSRSLEPVDVQWVKGKRHTAITAIREALEDHTEQHLEMVAKKQEPVAVYVGETWCGSVVRLYEDLPLETHLYISPPIEATPLASQSRSDVKPWVGLSTDEIYDMYNEPRSDAEMVEFARAIEAKLKEKNSQ